MTLDDPRLYVRFDGFKDDGYDHMTIELRARLQEQGLQFNADYGRPGKTLTGGGYLEPKSYVSVCKNLSVASFEMQAACAWLDFSFEEYYRKLNAI